MKQIKHLEQEIWYERCFLGCVPSCLLYKYLSLDDVPSISGNDASCVNDNHLPHPCPTERVTPRHPDMAVCSGHDVSDAHTGSACAGLPWNPHLFANFLAQLTVELRASLPSAGDYVLVMEYSSEEESPQLLSVTANVPGARRHHHHVTLLLCKYR